MGLVAPYGSTTDRFEDDSASAARDFLRGHGIAEASIDIVWEMHILGLSFPNVADRDRQPVVEAHPRGDRFKEGMVEAVFQGFMHKPDATFGTVNDRVIAVKEPHVHRTGFCSVIRHSSWPG